MWDSVFMTEMNNFSTINENFDTIKTLLNSIRAQGILNTSDVDKLLSGINTKLEKINTEEDIDLIKIFLSELKQNLDERHGVLISKFGAIESLFSNLLKNSSEMPKSSDIKELFDIVATNLSVFSREVVSQKESLTDITLRLDALRSDDSDKRDIIKNITLLKPDLERLNNGFDSIVISLNDNFKTIVKTISTIDKTEHLDKFSDSLKNIEMSSNTVLSALQVLDKKTEQVEGALQNLATKDDISSSNKHLLELTAQSQELAVLLTDLSDRYVRIDNLADKIDASVSIIATLKSTLEEVEDKHTTSILEQLRGLEAELQTISNDEKFEEFKKSLESIVNNLAATPAFQNIVSAIGKMEADVKSSITEVSQKIATLQDANITRVLNDISAGADSLGTKLNQTQSALAVLCEKNFGSVFENIADLRTLLSQIDENSISANNAIFSSITDRLTVFENALTSSLDAQEKSVNQASAQLIEQIDNIKSLSNVLDYKMDSSVVEVSNIKKEFSTLQSAIEAVLALDFVNVVKDLRVDLYASKQELANVFESTSNELSDKITNDLYGKYELLISKLDSVEDEFKKSQSSSLFDLKNILEKIASSIVDVISYVSESKNQDFEGFDAKIAELSNLLKENSLNYVESVRDVVDVIRVQVENSIKSIEEENLNNFDSVKRSISENSEDIKKELKYSYSKLIEIQDAYKEIKEQLNVSSLSSSDKIQSILASADGIKSDLDKKLSALKNVLLDKITDFKQEFTCENAEKVTEIKFSVESLYNKNVQEITEILDGLKEKIDDLSKENDSSKESALVEIKENFEQIKSVLDKVDENIDGDLTRQLSIIESNFESLVSQITILFDKSDKTLTDKINNEFVSISEQLSENVMSRLEDYKLKIETTFDGLQAKNIEQSKYLQERIADLNSALKQVFEEQSEENSKQIEEIAITLKDVIDENIKLTAVDYVALKNKLTEFAKNIETNNEVLTQDLKAQMDDITKYIDSVLDLQAQESSAKQEEFVALINDKALENKVNIEKLGETLQENIELLKSFTAEISAGELQTMDSYLDNLSKQLEAEKQHIQVCKDLIVECVKNDLNILSKNVEKETDVIIAELIEQFDLLKNAQADDVVNLTSRIEDIVNAHIYNNIEELKSYLDIKTDNSVMTSKLDNLKIEMISSFGGVVNDMNKLLAADVFKTALSDFRLANEVLVGSAADRINATIESFVTENGRSFEEKLALFDKKFIETIVDKYEEIKLITNKYNDSYDEVQKSIVDVLASFNVVKEDINNKLNALAETIKEAYDSTNKEVRLLNESFENLRSQISNKSFDEAFQASINKQISSLESLINEQLGYIEDINELCASNLPDVTELNTLVKHSIMESLVSFSEKLDSNNVEEQLNQLKTEIVTQILNVFNQVSFAAEQDEILDFIQEKHDELISVLSHIVTTTSEVGAVRDNLVVVDNKIDSLKDDINILNQKISAIISADGDVDYVYSLQELENDIAGFRLVLNEMKQNNHGQEFTDLISSTNEIYNLVESIKLDLPTKGDFEGIAEDIVSISTRTNKLILASDESYKALQDNLQEFKLVVNDLDERTRNFAQEAGIDRIDTKLNAINSMVINGAKTNQVFNQVFEYLAEWVDNASTQINAISNKVETLDDIGNIKMMLEELKTEASDNSESVELIEALGEVFDKQVKRISSLETKLDKIIVETTINNQNNKIDMAPMEETLNKFLVAIDEKMTSQQSKINSLEIKLEEVMSLLDEKDTAQLSKKVGGMDRQIAKLNKSIEKIASHVVEK